MLVKDILYSVRFNLGDLQITKYSDEELIEALNSVLRYVSAILTNINSTIVLKRTTLTPENGSVNLPDDLSAFYSINEDVTLDQYKIIGTTIYTDVPIDLVYYASIPKIINANDDIALPIYFYEMLVRFTESLISNTIEKNMFANLVYSEVKNICIGREYPYIERELPFVI